MKKVYNTLIILAIFSIIASSLIGQILQLYTDTLTIEFQIYVAIYFYLFGPMFIIPLVSLLLSKINAFKILILCLLSFMITFIIFTIVSMFLLDLGYYDLIGLFGLLFQFIPIFVLKQESFDLIMIFINLVETIIFLLLAFLSESIYVSSENYKRK